MSDLAYVGGTYVPLAQASVGIEDRGFQFADSVYEVVLVVDGRPVDFAAHFVRLERSMTRLEFEAPHDARLESEEAALALIARSGLRDGTIYVQVTRGAWKRGLAPSSGKSAPMVVAYPRSLDVPRRLEDVRPLTLKPVDDIRWGACDIKTTSLVANALARQRAISSGFDDALLVNAAGEVTEATAANTFIVRNGVLVTRPEGTDILGGITRRRVLALADTLGIRADVRPFALIEAEAADEAFITSATALLTPVVRIGSSVVGGGKPGPLSARLFAAYLEFCHQPAAAPVPSSGT